ncbi:hypothetical protein [Psychroflexus tropicus]|uniref:hypothetical protein n=1 Tax=Psychroflexus tropicus TaxID=197345 RepID=UPI0012F8649C|nr:hypothetical protein [Psychroflexus tropicus]
MKISPDEYEKVKENLKPIVKEVRELLTGWCDIEMNYIFEEAVIDLYQLSSRKPWCEGKYKIVLRETGEEIILG